MTALLVCELRRLLRSPRFLIFTAGLPLVYFLLFSGIYAPDGGPAVVVLMAMMGAFGAISASISVGGRVANERHIGWNRQLRLTRCPAGATSRSRPRRRCSWCCPRCCWCSGSRRS